MSDEKGFQFRMFAQVVVVVVRRIAAREMKQRGITDPQIRNEYEDWLMDLLVASGREFTARKRRGDAELDAKIESGEIVAS